MNITATSLRDPQLDNDQGYASGWDIDVNRSTSYPPQPDYTGAAVALQEFNGPRTANVEKLFSFGSSHDGGANFLMGDGSVKFISFGIKPQTFERLGTRSGGEVVDLP